MSKVIIYCGQEIERHNVTAFVKTTIKESQINFLVDMFPEGNGGRNFLENLVKEYVNGGYNVIIATRHPMILNIVSNYVEAGSINYTDVEIHLVNEDKETKHMFDKVGIIDGNWPFGVLG